MAAEGGTSKSGSKSETEQHAEALQEQIEALKGDLRAIKSTLADLVKSGLQEGRETLREQAEEQTEAAMENARVYGEALEDKIVKNPFAAVLTALGLGFIVGLMSRR